MPNPADPSVLVGLSDSLSQSGLYDPSHLSILGRAGGVETPQQRLMRLKHEVKELSLEMGACDGAADPSESFPSDVLSEVYPSYNVFPLTSI